MIYPRHKEFLLDIDGLVEVRFTTKIHKRFVTATQRIKSNA